MPEATTTWTIKREKGQSNERKNHIQAALQLTSHGPDICGGSLPGELDAGALVVSVRMGDRALRCILRDRS